MFDTEYENELERTMTDNDIQDWFVIRDWIAAGEKFRAKLLPSDLQTRSLHQVSQEFMVSLLSPRKNEADPVSLKE